MNKRLEKYDLIRTVAMFFTIAVHTMTLATPFVKNFNLNWYFQEILVIIFFTCNGLFFMLSGKFTFGNDSLSSKSFKTYYLEKIIKIIVPLVFYSLIVFITKNILSDDIPDFVKYFKGLYQGNLVSSYWFLYTLMGIYLIAPFLHRMVSSLNKKELKILLLIIFLVQSISIFSGNFIFTGWISYFFLGYGIEIIIDSQPKIKMIIFLGVFSLIISVTLLRFFNYYIPGIHDLSITMVLITSAVFLIIRDFSSHFKKINKFISSFSSNFLSVYLIHEIVLKIISKIIIIHSNGIELVLKLFVIFLLTLTISFVTGFSIDKLIIKPIQKLLKSILL